MSERVEAVTPWHRIDRNAFETAMLDNGPVNWHVQTRPDTASHRWHQLTFQTPDGAVQRVEGQSVNVVLHLAVEVVMQLADRLAAEQSTEGDGYGPV